MSERRVIIPQDGLANLIGMARHDIVRLRRELALVANSILAEGFDAGEDRREWAIVFVDHSGSELWRIEVSRAAALLSAARWSQHALGLEEFVTVPKPVMSRPT